MNKNQGNQSKVLLFIDDDKQPIAELNTPINFELDTQKLCDGDHTLKIVSKAPTGKEGIRIIPFTVRNGPAIAIEGLRDNDVVDGVLPLMINSYDKGDSKQFIITGSETPQSIPHWIWVLIIIFFGWAGYYFISSFSFF
jgi:hypothetical protein